MLSSSTTSFPGPAYVSCHGVSASPAPHQDCLLYLLHFTRKPTPAKPHPPSSLWMPKRPIPPSQRVPSSSPAPVRETQPQPNSPTTTERGTQRNRALLDTPPPDTQPQVLQRSERVRTRSAKGRNADEYKQETSKARESQPTTSKRKRPALRFDGESSDGDVSDKGPRQAKLSKSSVGDVTKSKSSGKGASLAPGVSSTISRGSEPSRTIEREPSPGPRAPGRGIVLKSNTIQQLGDLLGIDPATATSRTYSDTIRSLSDNHPLPLGSSEQYTQVRGETSATLSSLNQKGGGYHRDKLLALARPPTSSTNEPQPRSQPAQPTPRPSQPNVPLPPNFNYNRDGNQTSPSPPPLPALLQYPPDPASISSTQRAIVNAFASQPAKGDAPEEAQPHRGWAPTPIPEPRDRYNLSAQMQALPRRHSDVHSQPNPSLAPKPTNPKPKPTNPKPKPTNPKPAPTNPKPAPRRASPGPHPRRPPLAPASDPNTATEEETESEPELKAKKTQPPIASSQSHQHPLLAQPHVPGVSSEGSFESYLDRLANTLNGGGDGLGDDDADVLDWTFQLLLRRDQQRQARAEGHLPEPSTQPGSSSIRPPQREHNTSHSNKRSDPPEDENVSQEHQHGGGTHDNDPPTDYSKTGLGRYPGIRGRAASRAIPLLLAIALSRGTYQDPEILLKWARNAYRRIWKKYYRHVPYIDPPEGLLKTMVLRISWLRTKMKERVNEVVEFTLGFENPGHDEDIMESNRQHFAKIFPNAFHCRDQVVDQNQYEHPALQRAINRAFFWNNNTFVIRNAGRFRPLPLPSVAIVLTMMQECIEQWKDGYPQPRELNLETQSGIFDAHLRGLIEYRTPAPNRLLRMQNKWFKQGMSYAGIRVREEDEESDPQYCQPITRAANVRPDTPEPEPEYNDAGVLTAQSKGKGRRHEESDDEF